MIAINQYGDLLKIQISEIFATRITPAAASKKVTGAKTSLTLDRLVKATSAQISFDTPVTSDRLVYNIEIPTHINRFQVLKNVSQFRKQSLTRYVQALCAVSIREILANNFITITLNSGSEDKYLKVTVSFRSSNTVLSA